jgi:hypothetical protein
MAQDMYEDTLMERNYYQNKQRTKTPTARKQVGLLTSAG